MRTRLVTLLEILRTNFWFVPSVMLVGSIALSLLLLHVDARMDPGAESKLQWAYSGGPQGARSLLSTVAGSMITAASVTFSLASVALSLASQQYGSRVLRNFMRDKITQVMLGMFVATFMYSVMVVRSIRGSDFGGGFVPAISISVGLLLTLVSLMSLVYFIHHVSESIQAAHILNVIVDDLREALPRLYPAEAGEPAGALAEPELQERTATLTVCLVTSGYLQTIDLDQLMEVATRDDLVFDLLVKPGDFVTEGTPVARVLGSNELSKTAMKAAVQSFGIGGERTPTDDIRYQFQQLTDVVVRALSPGINDPFTAMNGIQQLSGALLLMKKQAHVASYRRDDHGKLRLVVQSPSMSEVLDETVGHIGVYAAADRFVVKTLRTLLDALEPRLDTDAERHTLHRLRIELLHRETAESHA